MNQERSIIRYHYLVTLENAAKGMTLLTDRKRLLGLIVHITSKEMRVDGCSIYIFHPAKNIYEKEVERGFQKAKIADRVSADSVLIKRLIEKRQPVYNEKDLKVAMESLGASLCVPGFLRGEMTGFLVLGRKRSGRRFTADDIALLSTFSHNAAIALENARIYEELRGKISELSELYKKEHTQFLDAAAAFSYAIATRDGYTYGHAQKVAEYSLATAHMLDETLPGAHFDFHFYETVKITSLLHDVGKIGVSDKILKKRTALTEEEKVQLKNHTIIGETILQPIREMKEVFNLVRHHHENFDGTGYPDGLKGEQIPLISRIISVADAYDRMSSAHPFPLTLTLSPMGRGNSLELCKGDAVAELRRKAGAEFDPVVVEAFVRGLDKDG